MEKKKNLKIKISQFPKKSYSLPLVHFIFNQANGVPVLARLFKEKSREREKNILQKKKCESLLVTMSDEEKLAAEFTATLLSLEGASEK